MSTLPRRAARDAANVEGRWGETGTGRLYQRPRHVNALQRQV